MGLGSGRLLKHFDLYIARRILVPLMATIAIAAMLLLLDRMLRLFDFVIREGGPVSVVWRMLGNLLPEYLGLGIPIGLMLGILLAFRQLALSSELDALRAAGVSYNRLLRVPFLYALAAAAVNFAIVGFVQPKARYAYEELRYELRSGALGASIKVGEFTQIGPRTTFRVEESHEGGRDLRGIFLRSETGEGAFTVTATRGSFLATSDPEVILLRLVDGVLVQTARDFTTPRVLAFAGHVLPIDLPRMGRFRERGGRDLELTLPELVQVGADERQSAATRTESIAQAQRRLIQIVIMIVLPFLAVALAVPPKRSGSALGVFLSIVLLVTYHKISEYTERLGGLGRIDPVWGQWIPFAIFAGLCGWLYYTLAYKPGGQPIGVLERAFDRVAQTVARWFRPRPAPEPA